MYPRTPKHDRKKTRKQILAQPGALARYIVVESFRDSTAGHLPTDRIWTLAHRHGLTSRDRALAYEILAGTIKRRASIDAVITQFGHRPPRSIPHHLLNVLRVAVYQLMFLDHVPAFAAIDLACTLTRLYARRAQVNFVNALLRNIQRTIDDDNAVIASDSESYIIPKTAERVIRFNKQILPPENRPIDRLAVAYSYPKWLVRQWLSRFGLDQTTELLNAGNARPALICRPNLIKFNQLFGLNDTPEAGRKLAQLLEAEGCRTRMVGKFGAVEILEGPPVTELSSFRDGFLQPQDTTSQEIVWALEVKAGLKILDLCAGVGTKTTQISELTLDQAKVYASDRQIRKLEGLKANAKRLGINNIEYVSAKAILGGDFDRFFDIVLADVPCSNTAVLARRPEVRWRLKERDIRTFAENALQLLLEARKLVRPAGKIGYSTCSIEPAENDHVVRNFLLHAQNWTLVNHHTEYGRADQSTGKSARDGGYWAVLQQTD